jgi:hypothetical protein
MNKTCGHWSVKNVHTCKNSSNAQIAQIAQIELAAAQQLLSSFPCSGFCLKIVHNYADSGGILFVTRAGSFVNH